MHKNQSKRNYLSEEHGCIYNGFDVAQPATTL